MLAATEWLDRRNGEKWVPWVLGIIGAVVLVLALAPLGFRGSFAPTGLMSVALGAYGGLWAATGLAAQYYPTPVEIAAPSEVAFLRAGSFAAFPHSLGGTGGIDENAVHDTLFNVPLRLGRRSRLVDSMQASATQRTGTLVVTNVVMRPDRQSLDETLSWVRGGGRVVLFQRSESYRTAGSMAIAESLGFTLELQPDRSPWLAGMTRVSAPPGVIAGRRQVGSGDVLFVVSDDAFCNKSLGHSMSIPTRRQLELYEFLYKVFERKGPRWDLCLVDP